SNVRFVPRWGSEWCSTPTAASRDPAQLDRRQCWPACSQWQRGLPEWLPLRLSPGYPPAQPTPSPGCLSGKVRRTVGLETARILPEPCHGQDLPGLPEIALCPWRESPQLEQPAIRKAADR